MKRPLLLLKRPSASGEAGMRRESNQTVNDRLVNCLRTKAKGVGAVEETGIIITSVNTDEEKSVQKRRRPVNDDAKNRWNPDEYKVVRNAKLDAEISRARGILETRRTQMR
jgi:hypothetical protein